MTFVGRRDGIGLRFDDQGKLATVEIGRFGLAFHLHEEMGMPIGPLTPALPFLPLEASLDMSDARYHGLDPYSGRQASQTMGDSRRTITVLQGETASFGLATANPVVARARLEMNVAGGVRWLLRVSNAVWQPLGTGGAETHLGPGTTLQVTTAGRLAIGDEGRTLHVELREGPAVIEMWLHSQPSLPLAPAIVLCDPNQISEAAIVASAVGAKDRAYLPILDLAYPPLTPEQFQAANARSNELVTRLGQIEEGAAGAGQGARGGGIVLPGGQAARQPDEREAARQRDEVLRELLPLQQKIRAYLFWLRRRSQIPLWVAALAGEAGGHVVALAAYPPDVMADLAAESRVTVLLPDSLQSRSDPWRQAVASVTEAGRVEILFWHDLEDLALQAWGKIHGGGRPGFFTIPDEPAFYPLGLVDALRRGRVLQPRGRAGAKVSLTAIHQELNAGAASDHAVIVEADGSVASLMGALYAHHSGARLYVNQRPDVNAILTQVDVLADKIRREELSALAASSYRYLGEHRKEFLQSQQADPQLKQIAAGLSILELPSVVPTPYSDAAFVQALTTYLATQDAGAVQGYRYTDAEWQSDFSALEKLVTAALAEDVRQAMAAVPRITAFTRGTPYSLVSGWEGKAVGLVPAEQAAPVILRSIALAQVPRPSGGLALSLDPGIQKRPAPEVSEAGERVITVRGGAASLSSLALLGGLLPLDALLLHSRGSADTVFLGDNQNRLVEVHAEDIADNVRFASAPLVVYASPLAWRGIGAACLEAGAAACVGTLWPVDEGPANEVARLVLAGALAQGGNPADVLRGLSAFDARTRHAYVYLGPAGLPPARSGEETPAVEGELSLYGPAARLAAAGATETAALVYERMRSKAAARGEGQPGLRAELLLLDADYQCRPLERRRERPAPESADKVGQTLDLLDKLGLSGEVEQEMRVFVQERMAALALAAGDTAYGQELLEAVRSAYKTSGRIVGELSALNQIGLVQQRQQQWSAARQTFLDLEARLTPLGHAVGIVMVCTNLAYVSLPLAMYPDAARHVQMAMRVSLLLGPQVVQGTLVHVLNIAKVMAQARAYNEVSGLSRAVSDLVVADGTLRGGSRVAIVNMLSLMGETAQVLASSLPVQEREEKLSGLVARAQEMELGRVLGLDAWVLAAAAPPGQAQPSSGGAGG